MLADDRVVERVRAKVKVDKSHDVPYVAGYSKDGKTIYIDRHVKLNMNGTDITPFLLVHEKTEKALLDNFDLDYMQAHHVALHAEKRAVEHAGLDWKKYSDFIDPFIKKLGHEKLDDVPKDLDLEPYKDENDPEYKKLVDKIKTE